MGLAGGETLALEDTATGLAVRGDDDASSLGLCGGPSGEDVRQRGDFVALQDLAFRPLFQQGGDRLQRGRSVSILLSEVSLTTEHVGAGPIAAAAQLMRERDVNGVVPVVLIGIFGAAVEVGVFLPGVVDETLSLDVSADLAIGEEGLEVGVFEGVVVGEGDLVDVVGVDELLLWFGHQPVVSAHA